MLLVPGPGLVVVFKLLALNKFSIATMLIRLTSRTFLSNLGPLAGTFLSLTYVSSFLFSRPVYSACVYHSDYDFAPVVFETSGAVNKEGVSVLKQLVRFASKREGCTHTVYAARSWARFSCCVQYSVAQQILSRDCVNPVSGT